MEIRKRLINFEVDGARLAGMFSMPVAPKGAIVIAHGSSRVSPNDNYIEARLHEVGLATMHIDLLTAEEETPENRSNIEVLAKRLANVTRLFCSQEIKGTPLGFFGLRTSAAAALRASIDLPMIKAVVSGGGIFDSAQNYLPKVRAPTLLIIAQHDSIAKMNQESFMRITTDKNVEVIAGSSGLFEGPGKLDEVVRLAANWYFRFLS